MGYGSRALSLLKQYYKGEVVSLSESVDTEPETNVIDDQEVNLLEERVTPRKNLPPLLMKLSERKPEKLDYLGVSYGLTSGLLKFWKKNGFAPVYLRQTPNDLTGEHSCIMLHLLTEEEGEEERKQESWLQAFWKDFRRRFVSLLAYQFRNFTPSMALSILEQKQFKSGKSNLSVQELELYFTKYDVKRLELYAQNMVDYHLIIDLLPAISRLYFLNQINVQLSIVQSALLLGLGLQHKTVEDLEKELDLPSSQLLGLFNRIIRKVVHSLNEVMEEDVEKDMIERKEITLQPTEQSMEEELTAAAEEVEAAQRKELAFLKDLDLSQYKIKGSEQEWKQALGSGSKMISIKGSLQEKKRKTEDAIALLEGSGKKKKIKKKHKS
ncbi:RNA cytidine acetyltransferase-like, partial [Saccostrea cucullata]|uniref:RNA cytidine acetyltransferase-like n=1 Tax=Saccostrea cuccullata TaxID=36930 RepID=UPI002ED4E687